MSVSGESPRGQVRVLVVGAGIGGLSCALALRTHGFAVDVVERSGMVTRDTVTLTGRCVDALADLGVLAECKARGRAGGSVYRNTFDSTGAPLNEGRPQVPHSAMPPTMVLYRPVLIDVLTKAAAESGVQVRVPCVVTHIEQCAGQVSVTFDDGRTGRYGVVVAADGVHSSVRRLVWGHDEITPTPTGAVGVQWIASDLIPDAPGFYYGPDGVVAVGLLPDDVGYVATFVDAEHAMQPEQARQLLRNVLARYSAPSLRALRERIDDTQHVAIRPWEWVFQPDWCRGRVVLLGDAAHATTHWLPAGAGLALIDAVVLAEELAEADDVPTGLAAYVDRRWERAQLVVQASVDAMRLRSHGDRSTARTLVNGALTALVGPY